MTHYRNGPGIDVAMCGARGLLSFSRSVSRVTCAECAARIARVIAAKRERRG